MMIDISCRGRGDTFPKNHFIRMKHLTTQLALLALILTSLTACQQDCGTDTPQTLSEEYYSGGKLGTTFNNTASCFEQPTEAIALAGLDANFKQGERRFETAHAAGDVPGLTFTGLGPLYNRTSCEACHPGYGHGKRITRYNSEEMGNGCLIIVTDKEGNMATSLGLVPMTVALPPFKPMIDADKMTIDWRSYTDEWGNKFDDGETYDLIYPEVHLPAEALYSPLEVKDKPFPLDQAVVTLESTIGIYGTCLLDAISDEDIRQQYIKEAPHTPLNPAIWAGNDFAPTGVDAAGHPMRFDYACDFTKLSANVSLWEVCNIITPMFRKFYVPEAYARTASKDPEVQAQFYKYFPERKKTGNVEQDIYDFFTATDLPVEMDAQACYDLMVWIRGLAVPAARDIDAPDVQRGKQLFTEIGCATCHRPSWTTGDDVVVDVYGLTEGGKKAMPRYPKQKIWPYTDLIQHRLHMQNDIRTGWCRTTPLWGRGLSQKASGHQDRLHDCRARNVIEAIMWHGAKDSDARFTVEKFRKLNRKDREAVVKFINAV